MIISDNNNSVFNLTAPGQWLRVSLAHANKKTKATFEFCFNFCFYFYIYFTLLEP